jgi:hypothetical protein
LNATFGKIVVLLDHVYKKIITLVVVNMNIHTKTSGKCNNDSSIAKYNSICKMMTAISTLSSNTHIDTKSCTKYRNNNMAESSAVEEVEEEEEEEEEAFGLQDSHICI